MGRSGKKGGADKGRREKAERASRWHTALRSALAIFEWADAEPAELRGALLQVPEILSMLAAAGERITGEEMSKLITGLERCWMRASVPPKLRAAAWTALQEVTLAETTICEAALARDVHTLALRELAAAASASAARPSELADGEAGDLAAGVPQLGFLWNACEALPEAAEALSSPDHVQTICMWATSPIESASLMALNLLLVLADGALEQPAALAHVRKLAAEILAEAPEHSHTPAAPAPEGGGPSAAASSAEDPVGEAGAATCCAPAASARLTRRRVLAAALLLALAGSEPAGPASAAAAQLGEALRVLRACACAPLADASVAVAARLVALEALSNALATAADAGGEEGAVDDAGGAGLVSPGGAALLHAGGGAAEALAARLAVRAVEEAEEGAERLLQSTQVRTALMALLPPAALLLTDAGADCARHSKAAAPAAAEGAPPGGMLELLGSVLGRVASRSSAGEKKKKPKKGKRPREEVEPGATEGGAPRVNP